MARLEEETSDILAPKSLRFIVLICVCYLVGSGVMDFIMNLPPRFILFYYATMFVFVGLFYTLLNLRRIDQTTSGTFQFALLTVGTALILLVAHYAARRFGLIPQTSPESQAIRTFPVVTIVVVVIAWFYTKKHVLIFCATILVVQLFQNAIFHGWGNRGFNHNTVVIIGQTSMLIILGLIIERMIRENRRQRNELRQANNQLIRQANTQRQLAVSQERNRMARELHDTLAHTLSGLTVQLETVKAYKDVEPVTADAMLDKSLLTTRNGLQETRRALKSLRAGPLEDLGLILALKELVQSATDQTGMKSRLDLPDQPPLLDPELDQCVFRITQEAVTNMVRHSKATEMTLRLEIHPNQVVLELSDNGVGFKIGNGHKTDHFGIAGMRERADLVNGDLKIESAPGKGTCVNFVARR